MCTAPIKNRQFVLGSRPLGIPQAENSRFVEKDVPPLKKREMLVRNDFLSVDPTMRGWVNVMANYSNPGPRIERYLLNRAARMQGFLTQDYKHRYEEAVSRLAAWIRQGRLKYVEDILEGLEKATDSIAGLYRVENMGKRIIIDLAVPQN